MLFLRRGEPGGCSRLAFPTRSPRAWFALLSRLNRRQPQPPTNPLPRDSPIVRFVRRRDPMSPGVTVTLRLCTLLAGDAFLVSPRSLRALLPMRCSRVRKGGETAVPALPCSGAVSDAPPLARPACGGPATTDTVTRHRVIDGHHDALRFLLCDVANLDVHDARQANGWRDFRERSER